MQFYHSNDWNSNVGGGGGANIIAKVKKNPKRGKIEPHGNTLIGAISVRHVPHSHEITSAKSLKSRPHYKPYFHYKYIHINI